MRLRFWRKRPALGQEETAVPPAEALIRPVTHRQFVKLLLGALGGAGIALASPARPARAQYSSPGPPLPDSVNTNLTVEGNLIVTPGTNGAGFLGIGRPEPGGKLDVGGDIRVSGAVAISTAGVAKQCYYTDGTAAEPPLGPGAWEIVKQHPYTWGQCNANGWSWQHLGTLES